MVTVLQIAIGGKTFTGVASYLYQQYLHMDKSKIHYDFLFCRENAMELVKNDSHFADSSFIVLNAVNPRTKSTDYKALIRGVKKALACKKYNYVVVNTSVIEVLYACWIASKAYKDLHFIAHAHNAGLVVKEKSIRNQLATIMNIGENLLRKRIRINASFLFACSEEAGKITFGESVPEMKKFKVVRNAIDLKSFCFDENIRNIMRKEVGYSNDEIVYGNVGSLCKRKNQLFLLEVFASILKIERNARLWFIGEGEYKDILINRAKELGVEKYVVFWGQRNDINRLLNGVDCFVFSTLSEGLGIVAIEAQAAGIPTIVSNGVPDDVLLTNSCKMLSLDKQPDEWAREIINFRKEHIDREDNYESLVKAGYDIEESANRMMDLYIQNTSPDL